MKAENAKVGMRVVYTPGKDCYRKGSVAGEIVKIYPRFSSVDEETGELWVRPARPVMKVDTKPAWWAYGDADRFVPEFKELQKE